ncbi:MAG: shikimate kinase [Phenylobacterium sp.]
MVVVFLHGPPAAGKLTVGREVARLTGYPLFHNHLIVDAVGAVFPFGSAPFNALRQRFWLDTFEEAARAGRPLIFTFAPEPTVPADFVDEALSRVGTHGGRIAFVRLTVSDAEQDRRIGNEDRGRFNKLTSLDVLHRLRSQAGASVLLPPADLVIDTERLSATEAAQRIVAELGLDPLQPPHVQFP